MGARMIALEETQSRLTMAASYRRLLAGELQLERDRYMSFVGCYAGHVFHELDRIYDPGTWDAIAAQRRRAELARGPL